MADQSENTRFLDLLKIEIPLISESEIAFQSQRSGGVNLSFAETLVDGDFISAETAGHLWAKSIESTYVNPLTTIISQEALSKFPRDIVEKAGSIGLYIINGVLTMSMTQPNRRIRIWLADWKPLAA